MEASPNFSCPIACLLIAFSTTDPSRFDVMLPDANRFLESMSFQ